MSSTGTPGQAQPLASPVTTTIASAPLDGYEYRMLAWQDFVPESFGAGRSWGYYGVYTPTASANLWASCDLPPGSVLKDIEWYCYNTSGSAAVAFGRLYVAGTGTVFAAVGDTNLASTGAVSATRVVVDSTVAGPYPTGTKLVLGVLTTTDGKVQVNGARVGFQKGGAQIGTRPSPVRLFDSASDGGILATGETRSVTLPSLYLPSGTTGVILSVTTRSAIATGYLKVYGFSAPTYGNVSYTTTSQATAQILVSVGGRRAIKVYASKQTHVALDLVGTVS